MRSWRGRRSFGGARHSVGQFAVHFTGRIAYRTTIRRCFSGEKKSTIARNGGEKEPAYRDLLREAGPQEIYLSPPAGARIFGSVVVGEGDVRELRAAFAGFDRQ